MARSRLRPSPGAMWPKGRHPEAPQTLAGAAYAGGVVRQRYGAHRTTRRGVAYVVGLLLVIAGAQVGVAGWWYASAWQERAQFVDAQRLRAALLTFRPPDRAGLAKPATAADLAPEHSVRTNPSRCAPLTLLGERPPTDGQSWSGINGSPAQPVSLVKSVSRNKVNRWSQSTGSPPHSPSDFSPMMMVRSAWWTLARTVPVSRLRMTRPTSRSSKSCRHTSATRVTATAAGTVGLISGARSVTCGMK